MGLVRRGWRNGLSFVRKSAAADKLSSSRAEDCVTSMRSGEWKDG